ncbi:MAG: hypothetical protein BWY85_01321 [Firmicutes bacterium ADurb.Bin506]|nr:MAG: hypothetical protein BWY85_01321 [Firmicutes bacterium ADurb.Bin506]
MSELSSSSGCAPTIITERLTGSFSRLGSKADNPVSGSFANSVILAATGAIGATASASTRAIISPMSSLNLPVLDILLPSIIELRLLT